MIVYMCQKSIELCMQKGKFYFISYATINLTKNKNPKIMIYDTPW